MNTDTATEPPVKKRKPQGKLDRNIIFKLLTQKNPPSKQVIAKEAGSLASSPVTRSNAVAQVEKSSEFQLQLEEYRSKQKERALKRVQRAESKLDYEAMALDQKGLGAFLIANEKLLHESVKVSSDDERERQIQKGSTDNMSTTEIESILEDKKRKIALLQSTIEGEIVVE